MSDESKKQMTKWLRSAPMVRGTLLRGVLFPDHTAVNDPIDKNFQTDALEQAWRVVSDTFQVLSAQSFPPSRLSWVYERSLLHCAQRPDGTMLGVFLSRKNNEPDNDGLTRLLNEFQSLALTSATSKTDAK